MAHTQLLFFFVLLLSAASFGLNQSLVARNNFDAKPCFIAAASDPFGEIDFFGVFGAIFGAIPGLGLASSFIYLLGSIQSVWQPGDGGYADELNNCIKTMINSAIEDHRLHDAKTVLWTMNNKLELLTNLLDDQPLTASKVETAKDYIGDIGINTDIFVLLFNGPGEYRHEHFLQFLLDAVSTETLAKMALHARLKEDGYDATHLAEISEQYMNEIRARINTLFNPANTGSMQHVLSGSTFHIDWPGQVSININGWCMRHCDRQACWCEGSYNCIVVDNFRNGEVLYTEKNMPCKRSGGSRPEKCFKGDATDKCKQVQSDGKKHAAEMYRKTTEQIEQGLEFQNKAFNSFLEAKGPLAVCSDNDELPCIRN